MRTAHSFAFAARVSWGGCLNCFVSWRPFHIRRTWILFSARAGFLYASLDCISFRNLFRSLDTGIFSATDKKNTYTYTQVNFKYSYNLCILRALDLKLTEEEEKNTDLMVRRLKRSKCTSTMTTTTRLDNIMKRITLENRRM